MSVEFCDTNVFVYAYDSTEGRKRDVASALIKRLWNSGTGALSVQVLQELFVNLTRKVAHPLSMQDGRTVVADLSAWQVTVPASGDVLAAIDAAERWQVSFWDAMILIAAHRSGASVVWSEDMSDGQRYDGLPVRNPFRGSTEPTLS